MSESRKHGPDAEAEIQTEATIRTFRIVRQEGACLVNR